MRHERRIWFLAAALVTLVGVSLAIVGSRAIARIDGQKSRQAFFTSSVEIASTLKLAIGREQDLGVNAGTFVLGNPTATEAQFQQWVATDRLFARFPELQGVGEVVLVPSAQLDAFVASHGGSTFRVSPPGIRPNYCFTTLVQGRSVQSTLPPGLDVCDSSLGSALMVARKTGRSSYLPYGSGTGANLAIGAPVYTGGVVRDTEAARLGTFVGWVGIQIAPEVLLTTALAGHPNTAVSFHYQAGSSTATFTSGPIPAGAQTTVVDLQNGWQVGVSTRIAGTGVLGNATALELLLSGLLVSLLLGILIYVLGTSRSRALQLVHERTDQLHHQALHDPLTGLPNRALILDRIERALAHGHRQRTPTGVLFMDLDDFKGINDTLGHRAGDELLVAVGARLRAGLRDEDTVGRLGGDEFVVVAGGSAVDGGIEAVAARVLEVLGPPFHVLASDAPLSVNASVGFVEGERPTAEELLQDADIALYEAKAAGKHQAAAFASWMREAVTEHHRIEVDLRKALVNNQFHLVYQPIVDLRSGGLTGVEALLRWIHPVRGTVMPDQFIPALESSGLIVPVGAWVLEEACRQGSVWNRAGHALRISVNVSGRQLEHDRIADDVHRALSMSGLDPALLILELTESTLMHDVEATVSILQMLKATGVRIAVDDFGTGFSSLAYLRRFPIDVLKIDRSFVASMATATEAAAIVHALVELGRALGLETIAEGIETDDQRLLLSAENVDHAQGFLFGHPMEVEALTRLLEAPGTRRGISPSLN